MPWLEPVTLSGPHAQLKPLSHDHVGGLTEAVKDGELWKLCTRPSQRLKAWARRSTAVWACRRRVRCCRSRCLTLTVGSRA